MSCENLHWSIDLDETGRCLERLIRKRGYSVREVQGILGLSCPQPIYRWMKGQILPSVEHLYVLSRLLQVSMEELLLPSHGAIAGYFCFTERRAAEKDGSLYIDREAYTV